MKVKKLSGKVQDAHVIGPGSGQTHRSLLRL